MALMPVRNSPICVSFEDTQTCVSCLWIYHAKKGGSGHFCNIAPKQLKSQKGLKYYQKEKKD